MGAPTLAEVVAKLDALIGEAFLAWADANLRTAPERNRLGKLHDRLCSARAFAVAKREEG